MIKSHDGLLLEVPDDRAEDYHGVPFRTGPDPILACVMVAVNGCLFREEIRVVGVPGTDHVEIVNDHGWNIRAWHIDQPVFGYSWMITSPRGLKFYSAVLATSGLTYDFREQAVLCAEIMIRRLATMSEAELKQQAESFTDIQRIAPIPGAVQATSTGIPIIEVQADSPLAGVIAQAVQWLQSHGHKRHDAGRGRDEA
jgi:hypothetical protein